MLLTHPKFKEFAPNAVADATKSTEVLVALSCENRGRVDELVAKAVAAGGRTYTKPKDYGFMCGHGFQDLDGHVWEVFYMDRSAALWLLSFFLAVTSPPRSYTTRIWNI